MTPENPDSADFSLNGYRNQPETKRSNNPSLIHLSVRKDGRVSQMSRLGGVLDISYHQEDQKKS